MEDQQTTSYTPSSELSVDLKTSLLPYKQVVPTLFDYFTWKKQFYPAMIVSEITLTFLSIWFFEISVLTTVSLAATVFVLLDYFLPIVISSFVDPSKWTEEDDAKYNEVCNVLSAYWQIITTRYAHWSQLRQTKSKVYYFAVLASLLTLAWLGNTFNSLFLSYVLTLSVFLYPGLKHHGILRRGIDNSVNFAKNTFFKKNQ